MHNEQVTDVQGLRELHDVVVEVLAQDHVRLPADPFGELVSGLHPAEDDPSPTLWTGRVDGRMVAAGSISLPQRENLDIADVGVSVRPGARGAGIGRAMLKHLLDRVRQEGRKIVHGHVVGLAQALLREAAPGVRWVNTWNTLSNTHMVAADDRLGVVPVERWTEWELRL